MPAITDLIASGSTLIADTMTSTVNGHLVRSTNVVVVALLSHICLKRALRVFEWFGIFLVSASVAARTVAVSGSEGSSESLGLLLAFIGTLATAAQYVQEEWLILKFSVDPLEAVGFQGLFGLPLATAALLLANAYGLEDLSANFYQLRSKPEVFAVLALAFLVTCAAFNATGVIVTKTSTCVHRAVLVTLRVVPIYIITVAAGAKPHLADVVFLAVQLLGVLVYLNMVMQFDNEGWTRPVRICKRVNAPEFARRF